MAAAAGESLRARLAREASAGNDFEHRFVRLPSRAAGAAPALMHVVPNAAMAASWPAESSSSSTTTTAAPPAASSAAASSAAAAPAPASPLVVLVHGWPDCWLTWRHTLPALSAAGVRAVAVDQRGFGFTRLLQEEQQQDDEQELDVRAAKTGDADDRSLVEAAHYRHEAACGDLVALLDALGEDRAVFCGHDWGGAIIWAMAVCHPERVLAVTSVCTPYTETNQGVLDQLNDSADFSAFDLVRAKPGRFDYQVWFCDNLTRATAELEEDSEGSIRALVRGTTPEDNRAMKHALESATHREWGTHNVNARGGMLRGLDLSKVPRSAMLSAEDVALYARAFGASGWRGGLNWYRNLDANLRFVGSAPVDNRTIRAPALMVCGIRDPVLPPRSTDRMFRTCKQLRRVTLAGGHWAHVEQADEFNSVLLDFLRHHKLIAATTTAAQQATPRARL